MSSWMCHSQAVNEKGNQAQYIDHSDYLMKVKPRPLIHASIQWWNTFFRHVERSFLSRTTSLNFPPTQATWWRRRQGTNLMLVSVPVVEATITNFSLVDTSTFPFFLRPHFFPALCFVISMRRKIFEKILFCFYRCPRAALIASPTSPIALRLCLPCFFK